MIQPLLKQQLAAVFRRQCRIKLALSLAVCWGALAFIGLMVVLQNPHGVSNYLVWIIGLLIVGVVVGVVLRSRYRRAQADWHEIARQIELRYPELNGLLLTAVQQQPTSGELHFLQERIVSDALNHGKSHPWTAIVPWPRVAFAQLAQLVAFVLFIGVLIALRNPGKPRSVFAGGWTADGVTITPGDVSIERGERLVVVASFEGSLPANVELVTTSPAEPPKRIALVKSLSDPVFGGSISEVLTGFVYRVEYRGKQTRDFTVKVFEYPRLERADADLTFPKYTGLQPKRIENTHRVTAVEGTHCNLTLQLNKPVARAQFVQKGTGKIVPLSVSANNPVATLTNLALETNLTYQLQLVDAEGRTNKLPAQFVLNVLKNREPELKIASPRGDSRPSALEEVTFEGTVWDDFGVQAYGLAYTAGGGEIKLIELGEGIPANEKRTFKHLLRLEDLGAKPDELISWFVWTEDIGPDGEVRRTAGDMYFAEVRPFDEIFRQGQGGGGGGEQQQGGQQGGGNRQSQLAELQKQIINATWKLQRQQTRKSPAADSSKPTPGKTPQESSVIKPNVERHAAWRSTVVRNVFGQRAPANDSETPPNRVREQLSKLSATNKTASASQFAEDLGVIREAVEQAISQAEAARERQTSPKNAALWDELIVELEKSRGALEKAAESPDSLTEALAAERSAFQVLLKLQQREYEVSRNRNQRQSGSSSSRDQQMQRQLDQMDLTQPENRYENQRLAQPPQSQERREQLQVMNRLSELARRQQDLNDRLKELQTALQEARTEQEREELRRQLKRLQEEEQRMLADVDELQQRMNQAENQSRMSEQRQQLEQTRQEMQRAAEAAQQGSPSQALASGTRAQRQLQEMRENMRKQNASEFAEDLKQLRADAREAERQQQQIQKQIDSTSNEKPKSLDDSSDQQKALEQLAQQSQRLTNLVDRATQLSQQTEEAEPLVSRELYDSLRKFSQDDANSIRQFQDELIQRGLLRTELYRRLSEMAKEDGVKSVELTSEMLREGLLPQARQAGERANSTVRDLARGIERATEKVLGDDTEALRQAREQLDDLTKQLEREVARAQGATSTNEQNQAAAGGTNSQSQASAQSQQPGEGQPGERSQQASNQSGENQPGREGQEGQQAQQGRQGQQGQQDQQGQEGQAQHAKSENSQSNQGESAQAQGRGQGNRSGQNQPGENQPGQEQREAQANQRGGQQDGTANSGRNSRTRRGLQDNATGGGYNDTGRLPAGFDQFLETGRGGGNPYGGEVITGENFVPWSDRLREVEEMVELPSLQNQIATARERARLMRQEYRRNRETPDWKTVQSNVVKPLIEVRDQIAEELARRGSRENLVPIDRDPVPNRYSELVRKYYEELGKDK